MLLTLNVPEGEERLDVAERVDGDAQLAELLRAACASVRCGSRRSRSGPECSASSYAVVSAIASPRTSARRPEPHHRSLLLGSLVRGEIRWSRSAMYGYVPVTLAAMKYSSGRAGREARTPCGVRTGVHHVVPCHVRYQNHPVVFHIAFEREAACGWAGLHSRAVPVSKRRKCSPC